MPCVDCVLLECYEGNGAGYVVHVDVHGQWVILWVAIATEHGRYGLIVLYAEGCGVSSGECLVHLYLVGANRLMCM